MTRYVAECIACGLLHLNGKDAWDTEARAEVEAAKHRAFTKRFDGRPHLVMVRPEEEEDRCSH